MVVTLTTTAKNWLATHAGVGNCFSPSGVSYTLPDTHAVMTGSTGDVVNAFFVAHLVGLDTAPAIIIANTDYNGFKAINGGTDIGFDDVNFAYTNDGATSGISAYCAVVTGASFTSTPTGASIYIDGSVTSSGTTPATITGLTVGTHTYKLTYIGYVDKTGSFVIVADTVTPVDVTLIQKGDVFISSTPPGASIRINNVIQTGVTPQTITGLAPGSYTYKLNLHGYEEARGTFIIISGQTTTVTVTLRVEAREAGMAGLLIVGLALGTILMAKKEKEKKKYMEM